MVSVLIDVETRPELLERLSREDGVSVEILEPASCSRWIPEHLALHAEVLFCMFAPVNIGSMKNLKLIQLNSAGYSQLFGLDLVERGISACSAQGVFDTPIAEWCASMMINLARDLRGMIRNQESGIWDRSARFQREIRGLTAGIWGYGAIGRETARLAAAMGMEVRVMGRSHNRPDSRKHLYRIAGTGDPEGMIPERIYAPGEEEAFLQDLDFLIIALPLSKQTEGLIGERELRMLPRRAFLLNPARGRIIREEALQKALDEGWIAGAALDTHYYYPMPPDHFLWKYPNVIMTPHISGSSLSSHYLERVWDIFLENLSRYQAGLPLLNEITPERLLGG